MNKDRAIAIAEKKLNMKFTGKGYFYEGNYYLEMGPKDYDFNRDGALLDSYYIVDSRTAKVRPYGLSLQGPQDIRKMQFFT